MTKYETDQIFKSRLQNEDDKTIAKRMSIKAKTIASYCYRNGLTDSNIDSIVRYIYKRYLEGAIARNICAELEKSHIPTPSGKERWFPSTVLSILSNEKYKGDALLQKSYTSDFLTKKVRKNNGVLPKYYVENGHIPIIVPEDWEVVQEEIARRRSIGKAYSFATVLSSKLICEDCGGFFGVKVWHSNEKYRCIIYRCNNKYEKKKYCKTGHFTESEIQYKFLLAYNEYIGDRECVIRGAEKMCRVLSDTTAMTQKHKQKREIRDEKAELYRVLLSRETEASPKTFRQRKKKLNDDYSAAVKEVEAITQKISEINNRRIKLMSYINDLREKTLILEQWDTSLWITMIKHCVVHRDDSITFVFRDGEEITI